jgi:pimeloyl-ACP methyl ester carboxylesterase
LRQWSLDRVEFQYGLTLPENIEEEPPDLPLVVFLHGLNSRPEDLNTLVERVQDVGLPCATYRYPNDQALEQSAAQFAQSLRRLPGITRRRPLSLITHSMGGLVARAVVEDPMLDPGTIRHLVMIAPPNHGSELARYAISLDVVEYVSSRQRRQEAGPLVGAFADGFSEAVRDLRPESKFLQQLNSRPRNPRVHYSLVIGTQGVVPPKRISKVRRALAWSAQHCSWMQACEDQWVECVASVPELIDGSGDGVVAVHRSRLKGVDDVLLTPVSHGDLLRPAADVHVDQVHRWILERLTKDSGVTQ